MKPIRTLDMFCGAGGSSWGAHSAGAKIVAGFDIWDTAGSVYQDNFPDARFYPHDLNEVDPVGLKKEVGRIDLILASPECTNHSPAKGNRPRCERSRETAFHVVRFAEVFEPRWIVVENVINMRNWAKYPAFLEALSALGYHHIEQVLDSSEFGVPQKRRRLFIVFDRRSQPLVTQTRCRKLRVADVIINKNGVYSYSKLRIEKRAPATLERADRAMASLGKKEPFIIVYYGTDHAGGWQRVDQPLRTITTLDRFAYVRPSRKGHEMRMLQPEELKLAMGWPKSYRIERGVRRDKIKMIGNAVCPGVMHAVVKQLIMRCNK